MLGTKTHLYGYISCGTNSLPLVHIYHLKTEGPLLNENHKICKITQTTTKFFHNGCKSFEPFTTKSFSSEHMYNDIFPIPSHIIGRQKLHHYTLPPHFQRNFLQQAGRNSTAITTIITATLFSGAII